MGVTVRLLPVLVLVILLGVVAMTRRSKAPRPWHTRGEVAPAGKRPLGPSVGDAASGGVPGTDTASPGLDVQLRGWAEAGLLSGEQVVAILEHEGARAHAPELPEATRGERSRLPVVAEALGYLGGVLAAVGVGLVLSRAWQDIATAGRLSLAGVGALGLLGAGALVDEEGDPALARLRGTLWLASSAATAFAAGVALHEGLAVDDGLSIAAGVATTTTLHGALTWWRRPRPLQELVCLGGLIVTVGTATGLVVDAAWSGLAMWLVGATLVGAGLRRQLPLPVIAEATGALGIAAGGFTVASDLPGAGLPFLLVSGLGLVALSLLPLPNLERVDEAVLGSLGAVLLLQAVPSTLAYFAMDAGGPTGLSTWLVGAALVLVAAHPRLGRSIIRRAPVVETLGALTMVGGAALTATQWAGFAPAFGALTAVGLVALGTLPDRVPLSVVGSGGLLVNVPWGIGRYFPGDERAPILLVATGALLVAVAVLLSRTLGHRTRPDPRDTVRAHDPARSDW